MNEASLDLTRVCLTAVGHDPEGRWVSNLENTEGKLSELYADRLISFTPITNRQTIQTAEQTGWQVTLENLKLGPARMKGIERALGTFCNFVNLWDADRLLYATTIASSELAEFVAQIPTYDFSFTGATREAIDTHQPSLTSWESVKSWALGDYLGIEGDIANRGCFAFSREFATFLMTHFDPNHADGVDGVFPMMALVFQKFIREGSIGETERDKIGYLEYPNTTSYEDYIFEGLTREESKARKNTTKDFIRRGKAFLRQMEICDEIAIRFALTSSTDRNFSDLYNRGLHS